MTARLGRGNRLLKEIDEHKCLVLREGHGLCVVRQESPRNCLKRHARWLADLSRFKNMNAHLLVEPEARLTQRSVSAIR